MKTPTEMTKREALLVIVKSFQSHVPFADATDEQVNACDVILEHWAVCDDQLRVS